jgi:hypothetical protein
MNRLAALLPARLLTPTLTPEHRPAGARPPVRSVAATGSYRVSGPPAVAI